MSKYIFIFLFTINSLVFLSQELNCQVTVVGNPAKGQPAFSTTEQQIFEQLQKSIFEFMNNTKWTKDSYTQAERLDCSAIITVTQKLSADEYKATLQIQSRRPVYKSSYYTPLVNYVDENFVFKFQQFEQLDFNINAYTSNMTSVLAFYAYVFLANDYDSFSNLGGTEYFQKAQTIVANAQSSSEVGWKSSENTKNRFWIAENALQPVFQPIRECIYKYHRLGLDIMNEKPDAGRAEILKSTDLLLTVYQNRPASFIMELFFNAKVDEFVNIFSKGLPAEKTKIVENLTRVNPNNSNKYFKIQGN